MKLKTREAFHNIKTFDRAEDLAKKTRQGVSDLNQSVDQVQESGYESGTDYAGNQVQNAEGQFTRHGFYTADRIGKWGMRTTKNNLKRLYSGRKATESANSAKAKIIFNTTPRHTARHTVNKNRLRRTSGANPVSVSKQFVKSRATAKASQRAAQFAKQAAKTTVKVVKKTVKATIAAVKAVNAGTKALIAALAAGGWIAVVVVVMICVIALIAGSVYGIFAPSKQSNAITIWQAVQDIQSEYAEAQAALQSGYEYDLCEYRGTLPDWKDIIAVYAVKYSTDVISAFNAVPIFDAEQVECLRTVFWEMTQLSAYTEARSQIYTQTTISSDGEIIEIQEEVQTTCLIIESFSMSALDMAEYSCFTEEQKDLLIELLNQNELWDAVLTVG